MRSSRRPSGRRMCALVFRLRGRRPAHPLCLPLSSHVLTSAFLARCTIRTSCPSFFALPFARLPRRSLFPRPDTLALPPLPCLLDDPIHPCTSIPRPRPIYAAPRSFPTPAACSTTRTCQPAGQVERARPPAVSAARGAPPESCRRRKQSRRSASLPTQHATRPRRPAHPSPRGRCWSRPVAPSRPAETTRAPASGRAAGPRERRGRQGSSAKSCGLHRQHPVEPGGWGTSSSPLRFVTVVVRFSLGCQGWQLYFLETLPISLTSRPREQSREQGWDGERSATGWGGGRRRGRRTRGERLLELLGLLGVGDRQRVQVLGTADLELGHLGVLGLGRSGDRLLDPRG